MPYTTCMRYNICNHQVWLLRSFKAVLGVCLFWCSVVVRRRISIHNNLTHPRQPSLAIIFSRYPVVRTREIFSQTHCNKLPNQISVIASLFAPLRRKSGPLITGIIPLLLPNFPNNEEVVSSLPATSHALNRSANLKVDGSRLFPRL